MLNSVDLEKWTIVFVGIIKEAFFCFFFFKYKLCGKQIIFCTKGYDSYFYEGYLLNETGKIKRKIAVT